jgi:predicted DCC family thiol-disulfide oxidoreductase YuxK
MVPDEPMTKALNGFGSIFKSAAFINVLPASLFNKSYTCLMAHDLQKLTLYYDGACPLCQAEILFLSGRNQAGLLDFIDINSDRYDPVKVGVSCEQALAAMYGQYTDGSLIQGAAVFPEAYRRANLPFLSWLFSRKLAQPPLRLGYQIFAKNRHAISRVLGPGALRLVKARSKS